MAWALHHLALDPERQQKAALEAQRQLGDEDLIENAPAIRRLPYFAGIAEEVLRMRSPAPFVFLQANEDTVTGQFSIAKGQALAVMTRQVGMKPELFSNPDEFMPERWCENALSASEDWAHTPRAQLAFGGGPRVCPGRNLAMIETQMILSALLKRFEFSHARPAENVVEDFNFTMAPKNLYLSLKVGKSQETLSSRS